MLTSHSVSNSFNLGQASPVIFVAFAVTLVFFMKTCCHKALHKLGYTMGCNEMEVDENLPNFFNVVKLADADWVVFENKALRDTYRFGFVPESTCDRLDNFEMGENQIRGVAWYNILANPLYARDFNYIEANVPSRSDLIVDGDSDEGNDCE